MITKRSTFINQTPKRSPAKCAATAINAVARVHYPVLKPPPHQPHPPGNPGFGGRAPTVAVGEPKSVARATLLAHEGRKE
jgi:hypothetical protein